MDVSHTHTSGWNNRRSAYHRPSRENCAFVVSLPLTAHHSCTWHLNSGQICAKRQCLMSLYKRAQQSPSQGSKSNQRSQHSFAALRGSLIGWFLAFMQLALSALSSSFFFSCLPRYFSPLQSIHFRDFRSSALKKKKLKPNFPPPLHVNVEFRQSCSQRFTLHRFSSASRFQVIHSGWRRLPEGLPLQLAPLAQFPRFHCRFYSATSFISSHSLFLTLCCCFTRFFCSRSLCFLLLCLLRQVTSSDSG